MPELSPELRELLDEQCADPDLVCKGLDLVRNTGKCNMFSLSQVAAAAACWLTIDDESEAMIPTVNALDALVETRGAALRGALYIELLRLKVANSG